MALQEWPARCPMLDFTMEPQAPFVRTDMDSGLARQRRRFRVYPIVIPVQFAMTEAQYSAYKAFVANINGWSDWFSMPIKDGASVRMAKCRFVDAPTETWHGKHWTIAGQVEKLNID